MKAFSTIALALALSPVLPGCEVGTRRTTSGATAVGGCHIGGCFSHLCKDTADFEPGCEWKDELACYKTTTCEPQADGQCGWTLTPELASCLGNGPPRCGFGEL